MAITADGTLWAWGSNWDAQHWPRYFRGGTSPEDYRSPIPIMEDVAYVAVGNHNMAIRTDGSLWAWGAGDFGELGDGSTGWRDWDSPVEVMRGVVSVTVGSFHTTALTHDGVLWAWGDNSSGQLGDGTTRNRRNPVQIMEGVRVT